MSRASKFLGYPILLDSIDALRGRKARPDKDRLCSHVKRKYNFDRAATLQVLEHAVRDQAVIRVRYKDGFSYRNPNRSVRAKRQAKLGPKTAAVDHTPPTHRLLLAIRRQTVQGGATLGKVIADLYGPRPSAKEEQCAAAAIAREIEAGTISQLANQRFVTNSIITFDDYDGVLQQSSSSDDDDDESEDDDTSVDESEMQDMSMAGRRRGGKSGPRVDMAHDKAESACTTRGRPVSTRKKIKKSLGPDFLDPSHITGYPYVRQAYKPKCNYCSNNFCVGGSDLIECSECPYKAHLNCFKENNSSGQSFVFTKRWKCATCQAKCFVCSKNGFAEHEGSIICMGCDKTFHLDCLDLDEEPDLSWKCEGCIKDTSNDSLSIKQADQQSPAASPAASLSNGVADNDGAESVKSNNSSKATKVVDNPFNSMHRSDKEPMTWSVDDVEQFVNLAGFPSEAVIFKEQEIDGKSLMLLKRDDVLNGLSIKLGPAVKIFAHINLLQNRIYQHLSA